MSSKSSPAKKAEEVPMEVDTKMESSKKCLSLSKTGSETSKCVSEVSETDFKEDT